MKKIKDRIILGLVSGILAGTPDTIINMLEYRAGLTDIKYGRLGANIFLDKKRIDTRSGKIVGMLANYTMIGAVGMFVTYLLTATGRDKAVIKGAGVGVLSWLTVYGLGVRMSLKFQSKKPMAPILSFFDHLLYGGLCGLFAAKLADSSLFPDEIKKGFTGLYINETD